MDMMPARVEQGDMAMLEGDRGGVFITFADDAGATGMLMDGSNEIVTVPWSQVVDVLTRQLASSIMDQVIARDPAVVDKLQEWAQEHTESVDKLADLIQNPKP